MAYPLHTPRVNNNDDHVQIIELSVKEGDFVKQGQVVAAVETDKAIVEVESDRDAYVLKIMSAVDAQAAVGSVLMWLGDSQDEKVTETVATPATDKAASNALLQQPTAKARALIKKHNLDIASIPCAGERLGVGDVEAYLLKAGSGTPRQMATMPAETIDKIPEVAGSLQNLSPEGRGMVATVSWHRDQAAHGYLEMEYDPEPWDSYAKAYASENKLMLSPMLPLLAYQLVRLAAENPRLNGTIVNGQRYQYEPINLGFTVQADQTLYLTVIREAQNLSPQEFIEALGGIQRLAMAHKLKPEQMTGATLSFSSMARWNVSRHIPLLPPHTSIMIAHAAPRGSNRAVLGASYDHRLLTGFDVVQVLQALVKKPA